MKSFLQLIRIFIFVFYNYVYSVITRVCLKKKTGNLQSANFLHTFLSFSGAAFDVFYHTSSTAKALFFCLNSLLLLFLNIVKRREHRLYINIRFRNLTFRIVFRNCKNGSCQRQHTDKVRYCHKSVQGV